MVVENKKAIQISPPITGRESSRSKEKLNTTTTTSAKNIMELKTSRDRHSSRRSLLTLIHVSLAMDMLAGGFSLRASCVAAFMLELQAWARGRQAGRARASGIRPPSLPAIRSGG